MDNHSFNVLDYYRIRDTIAGFCMSEEGKAALMLREPSFNIPLIETQKQLAADWTRCCSVQTSAFRGWPPVAPLFSLLQTEGACLSLEGMYSLWRFCEAVRHAAAHVLAVNEETLIALLVEEVAKLPNLSGAADELFKIIDHNGQMRELPEMREIKKSIAAIRSDIEKRIRSYTTNAALKDALQSDIPVIRGDRQVLAVKANFKGRVRGIVHEVSQTGQTLYVEPDDIVQRNNDLIEEEYRLARETARILRELTARLGNYSGDFIAAHAHMLHLDAAYAASRWGSNMHGSFAVTGGVITLKQARHPLLGTSAVPIDIAFYENQRVLIITGANTGGKTVALKTAALCVLLNQSGFPLPAAEGTILPLFDNVFADIGDEQSIDQSLSTFSGHMKNVAHIASEATENSLILLDELGSGTDTQEGGAIAMAVLDYLLAKKACVLVTTHHGILKNYGYTHAECANASVDFDENTLSPSYRILMGIPGESHALDIAQNSGLPAEITQKAQVYLENEEADVSALIRGLTAKHEELEEEKAELVNRNRRAEEKLRKVTEKELKLQEKEAELREGASQGLGSFTNESRKLLENLVRELREGEITREKTLKVKEFIAELEAKLEAEKDAVKALRHKIQAAREKAKLARHTQDGSNADKPEANSRGKAQGIPLAKGADVFIRSENSSANCRGTLLRQDKKGNWIVQTGNIKRTIEPERLVAAPKEIRNASISVEIASNSDGTGETAAFELRLLGLRLDEALKALEHQLDIANLQGLRDFSVVHGKGNGILQQGVQDYLRNSPLVEGYTFALPEAGGTGKTHVKLK